MEWKIPDIEADSDKWFVVVWAGNWILLKESTQKCENLSAFECLNKLMILVSVSILIRNVVEKWFLQIFLQVFY